MERGLPFGQGGLSRRFCAVCIHTTIGTVYLVRHGTWLFHSWYWCNYVSMVSLTDPKSIYVYVCLW